MKNRTLILLLMDIAIIGGLTFYMGISNKNKEEKLEELLKPKEQQVVLGVATQTFGCEINGSLPDPDCTPGAVFAEATLDKICVSGYTKTVRNVSTSTRKKVYEMYGIEYPQERGEYEVDHHVPLALGGNNDIANLWPEAADPRPGFKEKDVVEVYLYEAVCKGKYDLKAAQEQIAKDWLAVYKVISQDEAERIKDKYKNWSN